MLKIGQKAICNSAKTYCGDADHRIQKMKTKNHLKYTPRCKKCGGAQKVFSHHEKREKQ